MTDVEFNERDHAEWLDTILREDEAANDYEATKRTVEQLETEREAREAEWDWTAIKVGLAIVALAVAIAIPGIWWWCCLMRDLWGMW